jgi:chromosome partitioning protein
MARPNGPVAVCVINLKGGVGKSTIAALLARRGYTHRELDVLAIDVDPQANLSQGLMHSDYTNFLNQKRASIVEVFNGYMPPTSKASTPTALTAANAARFVGANFQHKDLIIIDCAPTESILTTAAYHASGNVLVPVKPE